MANRVSRGRSSSLGEWAHVVADHGGHPHPRHPGLLQRVDRCSAGSHRVDAARVGDELGAVTQERQHGADITREISGVPERLVTLAVLLQDGERQLGERLAHEVVDTRDEKVGHGLVAVAIEPLTAPQADRHGEIVVDGGGLVPLVLPANAESMAALQPLDE